MAAAREALEALAAAPVETFVKASDLPVSPAAARRCLAREAADPQGLVLRVGHGLYWRSRLRDRPESGHPRPGTPASRQRRPQTARSDMVVASPPSASTPHPVNR